MDHPAETGNNKDFVYLVAHELKTPIRAIEGFSRILMEDHASHLNPEGQKTLETIRRNSQLLTDRIDELLRYYRWNVTSPVWQEVNMEQVFRETFQEIKEKYNSIQVEWQLESLPKIHADLPMIREIIGELLDNAFRFARDSLQIIRISSRSTEREHAYIIEDQGMGFPEDYSSQVFDLFRTLHPGHPASGRGMGLTIAMMLAERLGGTLTARGKPGEGARFALTISTQNP